MKAGIENHQAAAVAMFSGLATFALDGFDLTLGKLLAALMIATATGAGLKLGGLVVGWIVKEKMEK